MYIVELEIARLEESTNQIDYHIRIFHGLTDGFLIAQIIELEQHLAQIGRRL